MTTLGLGNLSSFVTTTLDLLLNWASTIKIWIMQITKVRIVTPLWSFIVVNLYLLHFQEKKSLWVSHLLRYSQTNNSTCVHYKKSLSLSLFLSLFLFVLMSNLTSRRLFDTFFLSVSTFKLFLPSCLSVLMSTLMLKLLLCNFLLFVMLSSLAFQVASQFRLSVLMSSSTSTQFLSFFSSVRVFANDRSSHRKSKKNLSNFKKKWINWQEAWLIKLKNQNKLFERFYNWSWRLVLVMLACMQCNKVLLL